MQNIKENKGENNMETLMLLIAIILINLFYQFRILELKKIIKIFDNEYHKLYNEYEKVKRGEEDEKF